MLPERRSTPRRRTRDRLPDRETTNPALSHADLKNLLLFLDDDVRESAKALVRVGDPIRNIAPCASCHGGIDHKLGTPWLEGMAQKYLQDQLHAFASGARRNDSHAQMRNMTRQMTAAAKSRPSPMRLQSSAWMKQRIVPF